MNITLSKSRYMNGLQRRKLLWHYFNAKNEIPAIDEAQQAIFDQGHVVGELDIKKLFKKIDVTLKVKKKYSDMAAKNAADMFSWISSARCPEMSIGGHCDRPFECPLKEKCWSFLPERNRPTRTERR